MMSSAAICLLQIHSKVSKFKNAMNKLLCAYWVPLSEDGLSS